MDFALLLTAHPSATLILWGIVAGVIAAVVGGGMFFSLPVFQLLFPRVPLGVLVGNIKVGSFIRGIGSAATTWRLIEFKRTLNASLVAFSGTLIGAFIITDLDQRWLLPLTVFAVIVAELTPRISKYITARTFTGASFLIGLYTGFLGAGTGIFLVALFRAKHPEDAEIAVVKANARFAETFLGISAVAVHWFFGNLMLALWLPWSIGAFVGGMLGGWFINFMNRLSGRWQKAILRFGFALAIGISAFTFLR